MPVYRVELHNHCDCDTQDTLDYSARQLIDASVQHGVQVLAITPHREVFHDPEALAYAQSLGILLIPGVEKMIEGREIVLLNVRPEEVPPKMDREDLARLRNQKGESLFVFAPHPFYPRRTCIGPVLDRFTKLLDAVEWCHLYHTLYNPNLPAARWAETNGKKVIATSDTHHLDGFARNTAEVEAEALDPTALFQAIRAGKIRNRFQPYRTVELLRHVLIGMGGLEWKKLRRKRPRPATP
jgi:predicted metal-dependent phosphoesterase TrpH